MSVIDISEDLKVNFSSNYYILNENKKPLAVPSHVAWKWMEENNRHIGHIAFKKFGVRVSTVFLGLNHNFYGKGVPILFETMIFWDDEHELHNYQERYQTYEEAIIGHRKAVREVIKTIRKEIKDDENNCGN